MISYEELKALGVEWVNPSANGLRQGYFRKIPRTRHDPTIRQIEHRLKFAKTAYETYGQSGVVKTPDDRQIPKNAEIIAKKLRGTGQPRKVLSMKEKLLKLIIKG